MNFKQIIDDTAALQYIVELASTGCEAVPPPPGVATDVPIPDRRSHLKRYTEGWNRHLEWTKSQLTHPGGDLWSSFGSGVFVTGSRHARWFAFLELPSNAHGTPARSWRHDDVDVGVIDFAIDMDQDLLILCEQHEE